MRALKKKETIIPVAIQFPLPSAVIPYNGVRNTKSRLWNIEIEMSAGGSNREGRIGTKGL